ncbi:hypothetical protein LCGC14_3131040 [marine sediment metagenome]|uniref:thiol oxidase n=1 Tax=marine sediment metagenome TaxID=412755 RepID=A0A0F8VZL6_9ZZZZ
MSLSTNYWGESVWRTLYTVAYTYPEVPSEEFRKDTNTLYEIMAQRLPCEDCRQHYYNFLNQNPVAQATTDRLALLRWVNSLQNSINQQLGIPAELLQNRIAEMDKHNPTLTKQTPVKTQKFSRRTGDVSYAMRKAASDSAYPTTFQPPSTPDTAPEANTTKPTQPRRQRATVSYGIRQSRKGCTRCANKHKKK